jgi:glycosyltransferase involved in cell wall biosynthesis
MRFGVLVDDFASAAGATDFIVSVTDGLFRTRGSREVVLIFRGERDQFDGWAKTLVDAGLPRLPAYLFSRDDHVLERQCRKAGIDVIGPRYSPPPSEFGIPWVGYIYDFQHVHLPHYFSPETRTQRDDAFRAMLETDAAIVTHSQEARRDALAFHPSTRAEIVALPIAAAPRPEWLSADVRAAQAKYGVGGEYFIISSQLWIHKRHEIAIEAFARVAASRPGLRLVLTGATDDWRAPTRLQDLKDLTVRLGIAHRVDILGLIPKIDQIALLRGARAMIQPTAFEGAPGGYGANDAISVGTPTIVSDIPVNRELGDQATAYFPLDDVAALAACMETQLAVKRPAKPAETLLSEGAARRRHFGEQVWRAAEHAARHVDAR